LASKLDEADEQLDKLQQKEEEEEETTEGN